MPNTHSVPKSEYDANNNNLDVVIQKILSIGETITYATQNTSNHVLPHIALIGTEAVGKTSLLNALFCKTILPVNVVPKKFEQVAEVTWSNVLKFSDGPSFRGIIDEITAERIRKSTILIQVCSIESVRSQDVRLFNILIKIGKPLLVVLNKSDRVRLQERRDGFVQRAENGFNHPVTLISALTKEGLPKLISTIIQSLPEQFKYEALENIFLTNELIDKAQAQKSIRGIRRSKCDALIRKNTFEATKISSATSLPASEIHLLLALHSVMIKDIASIFEETDAPEVVESRSSTFFKGIRQSLSKAIPGVGGNLAACSALEWTYAVGWTAVDYFEKQIGDDLIENALLNYVNKKTGDPLP